MGTVVLDSSILIGAINPLDAHHAAARRALGALNLDDVRIPASVLAEILVTTARDEPTRLEAVKHEITAAFGPTRVIDDDVAVAAAQLRARHRSLRLPDALVIATGIVDEAEIILTADARWRDLDERVRVLDAPETPES